MINSDHLKFLIDNGIQWIESQRSKYCDSARFLSDEEKLQISDFFRAEILEKAKIQFVPLIENPPFYSMIPVQLRAGLINFDARQGITFVDTILIAQKYQLSQYQMRLLIFHELVHVVQYELLGLRTFVEKYVNGWAQNGFNYNNIPLEQHAYKLQRKYEQSHGTLFSVATEVAQLLGISRVA